MAKDKQYRDNAQKFDRDRLHSDEEAIGIVKSLGTKKFDETVDIVIRLGVDPRKADQMIRGTVALPAGTGKDVRVAVFAQGEAATAAREAGAEFVGADDLAKEIEGGMTDFDIAIATPDMMPTVGKLGRVLGPRGLMPNPKTGTVTPDVVKAINEFKGGMVEYRTDRFANVHVPIGKASFGEDALLTNLRALVGELEKVKPASSKGKYVKKVVVSTTMGPGVRVEPSAIGTGADD
ncbi:MAG: 50S ribosomal protein L1 [Actinomycetota bacterium]